MNNQKRYLSVDRSSMRKRRGSPLVNAKTMAKKASQGQFAKLKKTQIDLQGATRLNVNRRPTILTMDNLLHGLPISP